MSPPCLDLAGLGWCKPRVINIENADNLMGSGDTPLLCCNVLEHSYYLDRHNRRPEYLEHSWPPINWNFVSSAFAGQSRKTPARRQADAAAMHGVACAARLK